MKILILGHNGMLGHMVYKVLSNETNFELVTTELRWSNDEFKDFIKNFDGEFIINCIGAIHQRTNQFEVNWELPIFLSSVKNKKIIHPGTDCEIDDDDYGISKRKASNYIKENSTNTKIIKTSILGPEKNTSASLMEWFINTELNQVNGFSEYYWNGNTTLTWSKYCIELIKNWDMFETEIILESDCISKMEILQNLNEIFSLNKTIIPVNKPSVNKCLYNGIKTPNIKNQIYELKKFYYDNKSTV
jgi:dTDP-4-dehydrorhamnose reductase